MIVIIAIAAGQLVKPQNEQSNEQSNEQLNDGVIQVSIQDIPSYADKEMVENSIDNALFDRWIKYKIFKNFERLIVSLNSINQFISFFQIETHRFLQ